MLLAPTPRLLQTDSRIDPEARSPTLLFDRLNAEAADLASGIHDAQLKVGLLGVPSPT